MICKKCGNEIDSKSQFCEICGAKVNNRKLIKKIFIIILVILLIITPLTSRYIIADVAQKSIYSMATNPDCYFELNQKDEYIEANIYNDSFNTALLNLTNLDASLYFCDENSGNDEGSNYYHHWELLDIDEYSIYISNKNGSHHHEAVNGISVGDNSAYFENGKVYKCFLQITVSPKLPSNQSTRVIVYEIDKALQQGYGVYYRFVSYFQYENGQFIRVNK